MTIRPNCAVARRDDGDRIFAVGRPDCSGGSGIADRICNVSVGACLSIGYREQRVPDLLLEIGSNKVELEIESLAITGEVVTQLALRFDQNRMRTTFA